MQILVKDYVYKNESRYCGPTAIQLLTDVPYVQTRAIVNRVRGFRPNQGIIGMSCLEMEWVLHAFDVLLDHGDNRGKGTLAQFAKDHHFVSAVVEVSGHFVAVHHGKIADTDVHWFVEADQHPRAKCRVKRWWQLSSTGFADMHCKSVI